MRLLSRSVTALGLVSGLALAACSSSDDGGSSGSSGSDADADTSHDASAGGGAKPTGSPCTANVECATVVCHEQGAGGGGGGSVGSFCTRTCTMTGQTGDPACVATEVFTGKCSGQGFCQVK